MTAVPFAVIGRNDDLGQREVEGRQSHDLSHRVAIIVDKGSGLVPDRLHESLVRDKTDFGLAHSDPLSAAVVHLDVTVRVPHLDQLFVDDDVERVGHALGRKSEGTGRPLVCLALDVSAPGRVNRE